MTGGRSYRRASIVVAVLVATATLAGCQVGKVGGRCKAGTVAQDATHVLVCRKGRWARLISKADGLRKLAEAQEAEARAKQPAPAPAPAPPAPEAPTSEIVEPPPTPEPEPQMPSTAVRTLLSDVTDPFCASCATQVVASASGRYVAFVTRKSIDPNDVDSGDDLYLLDTMTGSTRWVSRSTPTGPQYYAFNGLSMDDAGTTIVYVTPVADSTQTIVYDIASDTATQPWGIGLQAAGISANGRFVAVAGSDSDRIFVLDRSDDSRSTLRFSRPIVDITSLHISDDGQVLTGGAHFRPADGFGSGDAQFFRHTGADGTTLFAAHGSNLQSEATADGRLLVTSGSSVGWLLDTVTGEVAYLTDSCAFDGLCIAGTPDISSDGQFVSFVGYEPYGIHWAFVLDLDTSEYQYAGAGATGTSITDGGMVFLAPPDRGAMSLLSISALSTSG